MMIGRGEGGQVKRDNESQRNQTGTYEKSGGRLERVGILIK